MLQMEHGLSFLLLCIRKKLPHPEGVPCVVAGSVGQEDIDFIRFA
jgi:hypothetical protein